MLKSLISLFTILLFFTPALYAQSPVNKTADTTIINVAIPEGRAAAFYYTDEEGKTKPPFILSAKDKLKKLQINQPTLLIDARHQIPFLIYPGESLTLQVDPEGLPIFIDNNNASRVNELYLFVDYYKTLKDKVSAILYAPARKPAQPKTADDFQKIVDKAKSDSARRFEFLRNYLKTSQSSAAFTAYAYTLFKYLYVIDVLSPIIYAGANTTVRPPSYIRQVDSLKTMFQCDSCLSNPSYKKAAVYFQHYMIRNIVRDESRFLSYYDTTAMSFSGDTRRFLLFDLLRSFLPLRLDNYGSRLDQFIDEKTDAYSEYLKTQSHLFNQFKPVEKSPKEIADVNGKRYSFDDLLAKYKGYVIYLDFWASWCGPCRAVMPAAEKLKESFKDKKIVFVDISVDTNPSEWKNAMRQDHLDEQLNYLLPDFKTSALINQFRIRIIPHYMVIDREGTVVKYSADFPNSPKLAAYLNKFLD